MDIQARGLAAVEAYNKALLDGKAFIKRVPVMIIGQDRTGKTSLKKSLKGEKFNPKEQSTEGIETDPEYFKVSTEIWRTGDSDKESEPFSEAYLEHHIARSVFGALKDVEKLQAKEETSQKQLLKEPSKRKPEASLKHSEVSAERYTFPFANEVPERVAKLVKDLLLNMKKNEEKDELFSILWDFGGQSVYYATHPIFLTERAIYILTCDLSRDPYQKAVSVVRKGLYKYKEDDYCNKTNLHVMYKIQFTSVFSNTTKTTAVFSESSIYKINA